MSRSDDALAQVVISNRFASKRKVEQVRSWGAEHHPDKDLAELLFMRGLLDRSKVSLVRRVAKMSRSGAIKRPERRGPGHTTPLTESAGSEDEAPEDAKAGVEGAEPPVAIEKQETQDLPPDAPAKKKKARYEDPTEVGRYQILERVAAGGMGIVYKARHPDLDRIFAVKILTPRTQTSTEAMERFKREAKLAARLDHPNIVRIYDAGTDDGAPYLVMDFIDGPDLDTVVKEEGLGVRKAARVARAVAEALEHSHQRGIVHRDVKPDNILIDRETGEPKITDFGIVKDLTGEEEDTGKLTRAGFTLGSPCYMSPEQAAGKHDQVGQTSDVYSLAATLYEMLTGSPPFQGDSIHAIMVRVIRDEPVPVRKVNAAIPLDLEIICMKGLEKEAGQRYQTAQAFADDLGRFLSDEPVHAKAVGVVTRATRLLRRHKATSFLLTALVLVMCVAGGMAWQSARDRRQAAQDQLELAFDTAVAEIERANVVQITDEKRRHFYEAIRQLDWVLLEDPGHDRARQRKKEVVLALGDHLIDSGEASFAEFVFSLGTGLVDEAVITSRVQAARLRSWAESAAEKERGGDLGEALRLYQAGLAELQRAGYSGGHIEARIKVLKASLARNQTRGQVGELRDLADAAAASGDHAAAFRTYQRALEIAPDDADLAGKVAYHERKAVEGVERLVAQAMEARVRAETTWGESRTVSVLMQASLDRGQAQLESGKVLLAKGDFGGARRELDGSLATFLVAFRLAGADLARERADQAAAKADEVGAERFALREIGNAREKLAQGRAAFERGDYPEAERLFDRAQQAYSDASLTSSGKAAVSDARERSRSLRARTSQALVADHRPPLYQQAEEEFRKAELRYVREDYEQARKHYDRAAEDFERILAMASDLREAFGLRARARELRSSCEQYLAARFAPAPFGEGQEMESEGDAALLRSEAAVATEAYRRAVFRYQRAMDKSESQASGMRECQRLRARLAELKQQVEDAELEWKSAYKSAIVDLEEGDDFFSKGKSTSWKLAKRRYERAIKSLEGLLD